MTTTDETETVVFPHGRIYEESNVPSLSQTPVRGMRKLTPLPREGQWKKYIRRGRKGPRPYNRRSLLLKNLDPNEDAQRQACPPVFLKGKNGLYGGDDTEK